MKKLFLTACLLLFSLNAYAIQQGDIVIGITPGIGFNFQGLTDVDSSKPGVGINLNALISAEYYISDKVSMFTGPGINYRQNYSEVYYYFDNGMAWGMSKADLTLSEAYASIPAVIRFYFNPTPDSNMFVGFGYQFNKKLYSSFKYSFSDDSPSTGKTQKQDEHCFVFDIGNKHEYENNLVINVFCHVSLCVKNEEEQIEGFVKIGRVVVQNDLMISVGQKI